MSLKSNIQIKKSIFVVIDMQNDYCHEDGYCSKTDVENPMNSIAETIIDFISIIKKKDAKVVYFKSNTELSSKHVVFKQFLSKNIICKKNTWGAEIYKVKPQEVFTKNSTSCFSNIDFLKYINYEGIDTVVLLGFQTPICIESTARAGYDLKKRIILVTDLVGCRSKWLKFQDKTIELIDGFFGETISSSELLNMLN